MDWKRVGFGLGTVIAVGCAGPAPSPPSPLVTPVAVSTPAPTHVVVPTATMVALVEPYLVAAEATPPRLLGPAPAPLGGRIVPIEPSTPLTPAPPTVTRPITPPPPATEKPASPLIAPRSNTPSPTLVRLFEEERSRAVDVASKQVALASARVAQATSEAKKTWDLVRAGALAQFKADQADATVRSATAEKSDADKALSDAQERRRNARRDVEVAMSAVSMIVPEFSLIQVDALPPVFRPVPYTFRLSILGSSPVEVKVENGTLGRSLAPGKGEAGAWIVRCIDPTKLRVKIGASQADVVLRSLPNVGALRPEA